MESHRILLVGETGYLCNVSVSWLIRRVFGGGSPLERATTNGVVDARTSKDLTRCIMVVAYTQTLDEYVRIFKRAMN